MWGSLTNLYVFLFSSADEQIKKLFTIENNPRKRMFEVYRNEVIKQVQRHAQDFYSMESKIAFFTARIRSLQEEYPKNRQNIKMKVYLKELIEKRRRFLRILRKHDYKRYEWLLEKLDIVYKPWPEKIFRVERKASFRKLTDLHCEEIKQQRLDEYRKHLESQQLDFLEKKLKNLKFIREEQLACKVKVTVTEDDIKQTQAQYDTLLEKQRKLQEDTEKERAEL